MNEHEIFYNYVNNFLVKNGQFTEVAPHVWELCINRRRNQSMIEVNGERFTQSQSVEEKLRVNYYSTGSSGDRDFAQIRITLTENDTVVLDLDECFYFDDPDSFARLMLSI